MKLTPPAPLSCGNTNPRAGIGGIVHILSEASGGNVNPAVSLALFLDKRISLMRCILYTVVQFLGGFAGAGIF